MNFHALTKFKVNWPIILIFALFLCILLVNSLHFSYPDEFDNIVGGYFIDHGRLPYVGFFTHHGPFAYFFASFITLISGASFVWFRIVLAVVYFLMYVGFYIYLNKRFGAKESNIYLVFISFVIVGATFFWGHMLLSDSLSGLLIIPAYILLFFVLFKKDTLRLRDLWIISLLCAFTFLTSITYMYAVMLVYLFTIIYLFFHSRHKLFTRKSLTILLIFLAPYLLFLLYLLVSRSLYDYYYQAIFFNKEYYITGPANSSPAHNPLRYAVTIFYNFSQNFRAILTLTKDLNFGTPFAQALALGDFFFLIYLLLNRKFTLSLFTFGLLVYLNARSNPYTTGDTDYQAIPYHYFSLFNGILLLTLIWDALKRGVEESRKIVYGFILIFLGVYFAFLFLFLFEKGFDKAYKKYMGTQALIYDRPAVANTLNSILNTNDYYYIGPFAFEDYLYMKSRMASRYFITIPAMDKSEKIKSELLKDLETNHPKVIVFNTEYYIFGSKPGTFLMDFLNEKYFTLEQLKNEGLHYQVKTKFYGAYDFERHFFFDRSRKDEILSTLVQKGLISLDKSI